MALPRLTIGMACYDDFDGVWFTLMALRMYHFDQLDNVEFVVVDNHPSSPQGNAVRNFVTSAVPAARYIPFAEVVGSGPAKNRLFQEARGEYVLCLDCHVLLEPHALRGLKEFYEAQPDCQDLLQGPLVFEDLQSKANRLRGDWPGEAWCEWEKEPYTPLRNPIHELPASANDPFEIPAQGMGIFACRRDAWLGFNSHFRGFGGEEHYIHRKYQMHGRRTLCLPCLRWVHRFGRPGGLPSAHATREVFRNYLVGIQELGLAPDRPIAYFAQHLSRGVWLAVLRETGFESHAGTNAPAPVSAARPIQKGHSAGRGRRWMR